MDKDKHLIWEANDAVPTVLALMAAICLWGFVASAAHDHFQNCHWIDAIHDQLGLSTASSSYSAPRSARLYSCVKWPVDGGLGCS